jgi:outer membrane protein assembly factor BamB
LRPTLLLSGILLAALGRPLAAAQIPADDNPLRKIIFPGEARELVGRLRAADALIQKKHWADGVDEYLRLIEEAGDDLVPEHLPPEGITSPRRSVQLRRLCHARIAALPPAALSHYRKRVDARARLWLKRGVEAHDVAALRRLVNEAFCSRVADQALDLLGDLAFERGDFAEARAWWRLLVPPAGEGVATGALRFPDPQVDLARVRAKQILALLFEGELRRARAALPALRKLYAQAAGHLAGRKGKYVETVQTLLEERRRGGPQSPEETDWPTFAGSPSRSRDLEEGAAPRLWVQGPAWRVRLAEPVDGPDEPAGQRDEAHAAPARRLAFHPVIAGRRVLVADARFVTAYDLRSGRRLFRYDVMAPGRPGLEGLKRRLPATPGECYTLSVAEGRVVARLGTPQLAPPKENAGQGQDTSYLVCLNLPDTDAGGAVKERWAVPASGGPGARYAFEGAPVVAAGRVYVAESLCRGGRTKTAIVCRNADRGAVLWRQAVCEVADADEEPGPRPLSHLLTLAGTAVVYCTHSGAVVSLDALSGRRLWAVRYPNRGGNDLPHAPAPVVAVGGRLFVAPLDSDRIFCLDTETGRAFWERTGIRAVQVLGVSAGRLIFTTAGGVRALDAATGDDVGGWRQPAVGRLPPLGRGLLAGGWVLWPTQDPRLPLRALNARDGTPRRGADTFDPTRLYRLRPGNMAFGGGCLIVADGENLSCYRSGSKE